MAREWTKYNVNGEVFRVRRALGCAHMMRVESLRRGFVGTFMEDVPSAGTVAAWSPDGRLVGTENSVEAVIARM
jgi:hypothetical protein